MIIPTSTAANARTVVIEMVNGGRSRTTCDRFYRELTAASAPKVLSLLSQPNLGNDDLESFLRRAISKTRLNLQRTHIRIMKILTRQKVPTSDSSPPPKPSLALSSTLSETYVAYNEPSLALNSTLSETAAVGSCGSRN